VLVDIDPRTFRVRAEDMRAAITEEYDLVGGIRAELFAGRDRSIERSAPSRRRSTSCFMSTLAWAVCIFRSCARLEPPLPDFDFTVPGVTSISTDLHKYGYAAKGCSVIMYRSKEIRKYQIFACTDTTAYTLINPTVLSSKAVARWRARGRSELSGRGRLSAHYPDCAGSHQEIDRRH
jgi:hypothetical protein